MSDIKDVVLALDEGRNCFCKKTKKFFAKRRGSLAISDAIYNSDYDRRNRNYDWRSVSNFYAEEILSEWEILGEKEEELKCLFCDSRLLITTTNSSGFYYLECTDNCCRYTSAFSICKNSAIELHQKLYEKLRE